MQSMTDGSFEEGKSVMKVLKTETEYRSALAHIEGLVEIDPLNGTPEADELELLAVLIEQYESERFPIALPTPVEAIKFRMEQQGLRQRDLIPYIGSPSKVSEVLSGKRTLSLAMIRALHAGLKLPLEVLVQGHEPNPSDEQDADDQELDYHDQSNRVTTTCGL